MPFSYFYSIYYSLCERKGEKSDTVVNRFIKKYKIDENLK